MTANSADYVRYFQQSLEQCSAAQDFARGNWLLENARGALDDALRLRVLERCFVASLTCAAAADVAADDARRARAPDACATYAAMSAAILMTSRATEPVCRQATFFFDEIASSSSSAAAASSASSSRVASRESTKLSQESSSRIDGRSHRRHTDRALVAASAATARGRCAPRRAS